MRMSCPKISLLRKGKIHTAILLGQPTFFLGFRGTASPGAKIYVSLLKISLFKGLDLKQQIAARHCDT